MSCINALKHFMLGEKIMLQFVAVIALVIGCESYGFSFTRRTIFQTQKVESLNNLTLNSSTELLDVTGGRSSETKRPDVKLVAEMEEMGDFAVQMPVVEAEQESHDQRNDHDHDQQPITTGRTLIPQSDVDLAFDQSLDVLEKSNEDIVNSGWKLVHENELYTLFKRRNIDGQGNKGQGPVEYMMKGFVQDVSPRLFLHTQTNKVLRKSWDNTMKDMETDEHSPNSLDKYVVEGNDDSEDTLYYRTKWPWPLKDRDYTLARRVNFLADKGKNAVVFVSKATTSGPDVPRKDGVIRVDNYWCRSTYFASTFDGGGESTSTSATATTSTKTKGKKQQKQVFMHHQLHQTEADSPAAIAPSHPQTPGIRQNMDKLFSRPMFALKMGMPRLESIKMKMPKLGGGKDAGTGIGNVGTRWKSAGPMAIDLPGTRFVTIFCDDSKVPLPPKVVDMISTQAEKVVPESMRSLHRAAAAEQLRTQATE